MCRLETGESPIPKTFLSPSFFFLKCGHEKKLENNHALLYAADTPTPPHMTKHHVYRRPEVHVNLMKYYCREDSVLWDLQNWRWSCKAMFLLCVCARMCACVSALCLCRQANVFSTQTEEFSSFRFMLLHFLLWKWEGGGKNVGNPIVLTKVLWHLKSFLS